jgi:hypothetical protein
MVEFIHTTQAVEVLSVGDNGGQDPRTPKQNFEIVKKIYSAFRYYGHGLGIVPPVLRGITNTDAAEKDSGIFALASVEALVDTKGSLADYDGLAHEWLLHVQSA